LINKLVTSRRNRFNSSARTNIVRRCRVLRIVKLNHELKGLDIMFSGRESIALTVVHGLVHRRARSFPE
jgi:hypothetical protein